jgi:uncharacterized membrane protein
LLGVQAQLTFHSGPLPAAAELGNYEIVLPGAADRILHMAEEQDEHRRNLEKFVIRSDAWRANAGLAAGLIVSLAGFWAAYRLGMAGHDWLGGAIAAIDFASLSGVFAYGTLSRRKERQQRYERATEYEQKKRPRRRGGESLQ